MTKPHICNHELNVTFRRQVVASIETSTTIDLYFAATIET